MWIPEGFAMLQEVPKGKNLKLERVSQSQLNGEEEIIDYAEDYFEDSITIKNSEFALNASGAYGSISYYHIKCYADGYQAEI
eukprot:s6149_g5.t1